MVTDFAAYFFSSQKLSPDPFVIFKSEKARGYNCKHQNKPTHHNSSGL
jgi:hypothetical protein